MVWRRVFMLTTHIYFNGNCKEAIEMYKSALGATVKTIFEDPESHLIVHAEIEIGDDLLMVNDFGDNDGISKSGGYQLCIQFDSENNLETAYAGMHESTVISPMQSTDYSPCTIRFIDKFDVRWAFMV
jgi:PhnB protein